LNNFVNMPPTFFI